jgi:hypothetical protein
VLKNEKQFQQKKNKIKFEQLKKKEKKKTSE